MPVQRNDARKQRCKKTARKQNSACDQCKQRRAKCVRVVCPGDDEATSSHRPCRNCLRKGLHCSSFELDSQQTEQVWTKLAREAGISYAALFQQAMMDRLPSQPPAPQPLAPSPSQLPPSSHLPPPSQPPSRYCEKQSASPGPVESYITPTQELQRALSLASTAASTLSCSSSSSSSPPSPPSPPSHVQPSPEPSAEGSWYWPPSFSCAPPAGHNNATPTSLLSDLDCVPTSQWRLPGYPSCACDDGDPLDPSASIPAGSSHAHRPSCSSPVGSFSLNQALQVRFWS
ncbi:unnamed protein product [Parajaminaea phylloscopi]